VDVFALYTDFDGTLSSIVALAADARPVAGAVEVLEALRDAQWAVGVVSGRTIAFLHSVLGVDGIVYRGVHGFERADGLAAPAPIPAVAGIGAEVEASAELARSVVDGFAGAEVEVKPYGYTVHYRNTAEPAAVAASIEVGLRKAVAGRRFVMRPGRLAFEVLPDVPMDKGIALEEEARAVGATRIVFAGDDVGDLPAFDALDRLGAAGANVTRVAVRSGEAPPGLLERADTVLDGPDATVRWLRSLL
jgi:trehalose 6-phosphate phosphatase